MDFELKCQMCRTRLFENQQKPILVTPHNIPIDQNNFKQNVEGCPPSTDLIYLNEDEIPNWILARLAESKWTKGRIFCPKCNSRIGGFDFVSGIKCQCDVFVLPSVHLIKSKVDFVMR